MHPPSGARLAWPGLQAASHRGQPLGLVLGGLLDKSLRRGLVLSDGSLDPFFTRPISICFATVTILILLLYIPAFKSLIATITAAASRQIQRLTSRHA